MSKVLELLRDYQALLTEGWSLKSTSDEYRADIAQAIAILEDKPKPGELVKKCRPIARHPLSYGQIYLTETIDKLCDEIERLEGIIVEAKKETQGER